MKRKRVLIVGGGIIGAMTAYSLQKAGWTVKIVEKERFGEGSSYGNCGLIHPSHVLPLNMPGAILTGIKWMFRKDAPLFIKPRIDIDLMRWLLKFSLKCNKKSMLYAAAHRNALLEHAVDSFGHFIRDEKISCDFEAMGVIYAFREKEEYHRHDAIDDLIGQITKGGQKLRREELDQLEPLLGDQTVGGWYYKSGAHLRPDRLMTEMKRVLLRKNIEIIEKTGVVSLNRSGEMATSVKTENGDLEADEFIFTTGAWTSQLKKGIGYKAPIIPGKGYSITIDRPENCPAYPCILEEDRVVITPWNSGLRLGGTMEFSGFDSELNKRRIEALIQGARRYYSFEDFNGIREEWYGWRPMTYDGLPIIGRLPGLKNVTMAAGHNMLGLSMAPATGRLVTEILNHEDPHVDPHPFRASRFKGS